MIQSVYLDTSVFGGYFDTEFSITTVQFFERILNEQIEVIISEILISELEKAPAKVRNTYNNSRKSNSKCCSRLGNRASSPKLH